MVPLTELWLPILVSAVFVFIVSSAVHMLLPYHWSDYGKVPNEEQLRADFRRSGLPPGDYVVPHAAGPKEMKDPEYTKRMAEGPIVFFTVAPAGQSSMARSLSLWFVYLLIIATLAAYVAGRALPPGAEYGEAFRFAGTTAIAAFAFGSWPASVWFFRSWKTTAKFTFDGILYGLVLGGAFGWLWP
jgi:hypothetical protein